MTHVHRSLVLYVSRTRHRQALEDQQTALAASRRVLDLSIVAAMPMVQRNASAIARRMPSWVEKQDLMHAGYMALVKAAQKFDTARPTNLSQYARKSVRGAMFELVRRRNCVESTHLELLPELIETPDRRQEPEEMAADSKRRSRLTEAVGILSERERTVLKRYYDGEQLVAVGRDMGFCKQTMTNIHRRALGKLQEYFRLRGVRSL